MNRRHFLLALLLLFAASGLVKIVVPDVQAQLVRLFQKGTATQGNCVSWFGNGVLQDAGAPCGGSGSVPGGIAGNVQYNGGGTFSGLANGSATQVLHGGSSPAMGAVNLGTDVTSTLPVANGGTGVTTAQGNGAKVQLSTGTTTTNDCVKFDANGNTVDAGAGCGGAASLTVGDGTHSVTGTTALTFGNGFVTNAGTTNATVNMVATLPAAKIATYHPAAADMGEALTLAATTGTPALVLDTPTATLFAPGMTLTISVPKITSGVSWTLTNSTGITMRGLNSTTLPQGTQGTFVVNFDGSFIDFFPGMQAPTTTSLGGILSATAPSHNFLTGFDTTGTQTTAQPAFTDISGSVAAGQMPALTGDITTSAGAVATTLATVNANVGSFTAANITVNAKGLVTAAANGSASAGGGTFNYSDNGVTVTAGTYFTPIGGGGIPQSTEANVQIKAPSALTVNNLQVGLSADPGSGQTLAVTMRKAGSDQTLTCTVTGTGGGTAISCQDLTHSISVAQNDLIDWKVVTTGTYVATPTITITANSGTTNNGVTGSAVNGNLVKGSGSASIVDSGIVAANVITTANTATTSTAGIAKLHNVGFSAGWIATVNPNNVVIAVINQASTISAIIGAVETATGGTATVTVNKAASGTACSGGTAVSSSFNANGTAATNQTITGGTTSLAAGDRLCLQTTGTTTWTGGTGVGTITVFLAPS